MAKAKKKRNLFKFLKDFFASVAKESKKIMWTSKKNLIKYSIATIVFMVFICVFFIGTDMIIALFSYLKEVFS